MTRDEFYEKFPWVFSLPERPQCKECLGLSCYNGYDGWIHLEEHHLDWCSRHGESAKRLYPMPEPP